MNDIKNNLMATTPIEGSSSKQVVKAEQKKEEYNPIMDKDEFVKEPKVSTSALKGMALKIMAGAAVGAGVMVLSGGSALAALGFSTAIGAGLGALKGIGHAIYSGFSIGGHSGSSSALDRNVGVMALLGGGIGLAKGIAQGAVLGALAFAGFGPVGGAVAGAVMPAVGGAAWHAYDKHSHKHAGLRQ